MLIIDADTTRPPVRPSVFLHGLTGCGKSTWAITGGRPLVILTEPKAASVLRQINPQAIGLAPESLADVLTIFELLGKPDRLEAKKIDRIILDSFSDLTYSLPKWIKEQGGVSTLLTRLELSEYGDLRDYALALVKAIQLTGYPSVIIARSVSKKIGRDERIVPDGMGKGIQELPGKLLPTVEARFDSELGYVIDSTPDEYSQRCGLPWLPAIWQGAVSDFLMVVEHGKAAKPAPLPPPDHDATPAQVFAQAAEEKRASAPEPSPQAAAFVDSLEPAKGTAITLAQFTELTDLCQKHKVPMDKLQAYCLAHGKLEGQTLNTMKRDALGPIVASITVDTKRRALLAHLTTYETTAA